jgi:hypothetical protein
MANVITAGVGSSFVIYESSARTATPDTSEIELPFGTQSLYVVIDCTAVSATPSVTFAVQGVDRVSGKVFALLTSAAITGTGTTVLRVSPHLTAAANTIAKDIVPPVIRVVPTHGDADSITYSVAGLLAR